MSVAHAVPAPLEVRLEDVPCPAGTPEVLGALHDLTPLLLDSGDGEGVSIIGLLPVRTIRWSAGEGGDPLASVARHLQAHSVPRDGGWPFTAGLLGYLGYGVRTLLERVPDRHSPLGVPDLYLADCRLCLLRREPDGPTVLARAEDPADDEATRFLRIASGEIRRRLEGLVPAREAGGGFQACRVIRPDPRPFAAMVDQALEHIAAGDVYQVNLSQRFSAPRPGRLDAFYARLRASHGARFGGFVPVDGEAVICISPERFLRVDGRRVEATPIKGTAPRGRDAGEDLRLAGALQESEKDRAELAMIVDVLRNDLARVSSPGSVSVREALALQSLPTVHHLHARIESELAEGRDVIDLLRAAFPGGSITGAPRIRAMQIIDDLEACARGPYCGSLGYLGYDGRADLNIMIRTAVTEGDRLYFHGGGGIVADSVASAEYEETVQKVRGFIEVLEDRTP